MLAEKVVVSLLKASGAVTAIVSGRIWPVVALEKTVPHVVYAFEDGAREPTISMGTIAQVKSIVSVMAIADDYATMKSLLEACRQAVAYQHGTIAGVVVGEIRIESESGDQYQPDLRLYGQAMAFSILHQEP